MIKLAESSGTVIYENENKLYISKKPGQWTSSFLFVTGLLGILLMTNGILQMFVFKNQTGKMPTLGIILSALGILFAFIFWKIIAYRKRINSIPFNELKSICVIDFTSNNLLDAQQNILSSLDAVQLVRKMQITSSSPALVLKWNKKTLAIVNGNPFSGGVSAVENALISKGLNRK